jgi:hypothetical protein
MKAIYLVSVHPDGALTRVAAHTHFEAARSHVSAMLATREYRPTMQGMIHLAVEGQGGGTMIYRVRPGSQSDSAIVTFEDDERFYGLENDDGEEDFSLDPDDEAVLNGEAY